MKLYSVQVPEFFRASLPGSKDIQLFKGAAGIQVICSIDPTKFGFLKHVSVSKPDQYPTWDELIDIRNQLFPADVDCMMVMPKAADYVNVHENCFHIWQCPAEWGIM